MNNKLKLSTWMGVFFKKSKFICVKSFFQAINLGYLSLKWEGKDMACVLGTIFPILCNTIIFCCCVSSFQLN